LVCAAHWVPTWHLHATSPPAASNHRPYTANQSAWELFVTLASLGPSRRGPAHHEQRQHLDLAGACGFQSCHQLPPLHHHSTELNRTYMTA